MTQKFTILFDLDGTLVDTAPDLMAAHNHVMKKFGHTQKKLSDIKRLAGKGAWIMMQRSFKEQIKDEKTKKIMVDEFINFYFVPGLVLGCIYALGAIGITLTFGILRFANFSHGEIMMTSSYLTWEFIIIFASIGSMSLTTNELV